MLDITISKELARQFAYECFDVIVQEIQEQEDKGVECYEQELAS